MTTILDTTLRYQNGRGGHVHCRLRMFVPADRPAVVVATEVTHFAGSSVVGMVERLAVRVARERGIDPSTLVWVEHRPARNPFGGRRGSRESFSRVELGPAGGDTLAGLGGTEISLEQIETLLGHSLDANEGRTLSA